MPAAVVVVQAVARAHVEPRVLDALELLEPPRARRRSCASSASISAGLRPLANAGASAGVEREPRQPAQLGVGPEQQHVDPGHHLRDVLVGDVRQRLLAEVAERQIRAVSEQQELEVVLPHLLRHPQRAAVAVEHLVERRVRRRRRPSRRARTRAASGPRAPAARPAASPSSSATCAYSSSQFCEVVAGALLEELGPLGDLLRVGDRVDRDVDVGVDDAVVDPHRRRDGERAVLPRAERVVRAVDRGDVERRHRQREVHRVPEPQPAGVWLAPLLAEQRVVGVHLLPALAALGRRDGHRGRKRGDIPADYAG